MVNASRIISISTIIIFFKWVFWTSPKGTCLLIRLIRLIFRRGHQVSVQKHPWPSILRVRVRQTLSIPCASPGLCHAKACFYPLVMIILYETLSPSILREQGTQCRSLAQGTKGVLNHWTSWMPVTIYSCVLSHVKHCRIICTDTDDNAIPRVRPWIGLMIICDSIFTSCCSPSSLNKAG